MYWGVFFLFPPFLLILLEGNYEVGYKPFWSFETDWRNIHEGSDVAHWQILPSVTLIRAERGGYFRIATGSICHKHTSNTGGLGGGKGVHYRKAA